ncbi:MAG: hypothetical protein ORN85_03500, partial [Sediminibacterium sp.]|nr:hypothetical protein [Sediminibacterium sp.]
ILSNSLKSQNLSSANINKLDSFQKVLQQLETIMYSDTNFINRFQADSIFIPTFVKSLKTPFSFYFKFDSLKFIKKISPPDTSFKIFTWNFFISPQHIRQRGVIQMNTPNGNLLLYPLIDVSEFEHFLNGIISECPENSNVCKNWIGAVYYQIIEKEFQHKKIYTLLGLDIDSDTTTTRWIDILTFQHNKPVFGGDYFDFSLDSNKTYFKDYKRYNISYKKGAGVLLKYDVKKDFIVYSHLTSLNGNETDASNLVPDESFDYFIWKNGKWLYKPGD